MAAEESPSAPAPGHAPRMRLSRPLARRDFRLLWIGETVSLLGDQCSFVALPRLVLQLTGSGLALGSVLMTAAIPRAAFMLLGGVTSDRWSPRAVMILPDCLRACVAAGALADWRVDASFLGAALLIFVAGAYCAANPVVRGIE